MEKWLKRFFVISLLIFLIIGFIYYFIPTDLNIAHSDKTIITIQSGLYGNTEIALTGNYNENHNFVHIYILKNEPSHSFAQLSTNTKYRMKGEDVKKIILFLNSVE